MSGESRTVRGTVAFIWEGEGHMLLNLDPDDPGDPHTFELSGELRERASAKISEGDRVEVEFAAVEYEVVDPDSGPSDSQRAEVLGVRLID